MRDNNFLEMSNQELEQTNGGIVDPITVGLIALLLGITTVGVYKLIDTYGESWANSIARSGIPSTRPIHDGMRG